MRRLFALTGILVAAAAILVFGVWFAVTSSPSDRAEAANQPPSLLGATDRGAGTPDLIVESIEDRQGLGFCPGSAGLRIVVRNLNAFPAGASSLFVQATGGGSSQTLAVPAIPGNGSATLLSYVTGIPSGDSYTATADSAFVILESNEANNSLTVNLSVTTLPTCTPTPTHTFPAGFTPTVTPTPCGAPDDDGDGVPDCKDNCPFIANPVQENTDRNFIENAPWSTQDDRTRAKSDGLGDACDPDDDNDGLTDLDEATGASCGAVLTNGKNHDTDGDRFLDGMECLLGTSPINASSKPPITSCAPGAGDSDGDRITDRAENCGYGTSPSDTDSDGDRNSDGATDGCEVASINNDRIVNSGDQLLLVLEIMREPRPSYRLVDYDLNKDGAVNAGDQLLMALFISPSGQCPAGQPDLLIQSMKIELETGGSCAFTSTTLGLRVVVRNGGSFQAPIFAVNGNSGQKSTLTTLAPGAITSLWFAGYLSGNNSAFADATFLVIESNEGNNGLSQFVPVPTLPPTCTPTAPPTFTPTVTHTPFPAPATPIPTATPTP